MQLFHNSEVCAFHVDNQNFGPMFCNQSMHVSQ